MTKTILRIESLSLLILSIYLYSKLNSSWIVFIALLFTPDISMIGYLKGRKTGALVYNLIHNYVLAIGLIFIGYVADYSYLSELGLILTAHIAMDRTFGFGLKEEKGFKYTHMGKMGK